jgi:uncharacterized protein (DUF486 family)
VVPGGDQYIIPSAHGELLKPEPDMLTVVLLFLTNTFMTFDRTAHLKHRSRPFWKRFFSVGSLPWASIASKSRQTGSTMGVITGYQLKIIQECITLIVFAYLDLGEAVRWSYALSFVCLLVLFPLPFWGRF